MELSLLLLIISYYTDYETTFYTHWLYSLKKMIFIVLFNP